MADRDPATSRFPSPPEDLAHAYPRPQLQRAPWHSLNGVWKFAIDADNLIRHPDDVVWDKTIRVPFSPETPDSGVHDTGFFCVVWYQRCFEAPELAPGERLILHFGAVDHCATVWVNGIQVCSHEGGYTPFLADITEALMNDGQQQVMVRAEDDPADLSKPRGKQDWQLQPHSIWYPRTTGIWQTVWLEIVPASFLRTLRWSSNLERWEIGVEAYIGGVLPKGMMLEVRLSADQQLLAHDTYSVVAGEVHRRIALSDPGIDDYRNTLLWSPGKPTIIDAELRLRDANGAVLDEIISYTALRSVATQGDRFVLNGRPMNLRFVLDQGYWPSSGLTAPSDDAFLKDVLLAKMLGFNGVRKHQKIEDPRFLYWADHMGLLVWEEMPSAYRYTQLSIQRLTQEWLAVLQRDYSHPCIISWVPFNESWGVPDLPDSPAQRNYVQALYHLTKTVDPHRPVVGNDGWESVATDLIGIHDYDARPERIGRRYGRTNIDAHLFNRERPGGRMLLVEGAAPTQPIVLTEFGGIALASAAESANPHSSVWGYSHVDSPDQLLDHYRLLLDTVRALPALAGFCYTQFTDTYQEANGLLFADRTPKAPLDQVALATNGSVPDFDPLVQTAWRERIMANQQQHATHVPSVSVP